ncbi:MAG: hypothetical protein PHP06_06200 [Clostridia bacterium]|nr:hypothetical protein [Clostridia bacterium]
MGGDVFDTIKIVLLKALVISLIYVGILIAIAIGIYYLIKRIKKIKRDDKNEDKPSQRDKINF